MTDEGSSLHAPSIALDQRHCRPIDRNHHARGVGGDFYWDAPQLIGLAQGVDDVELPQCFRRPLGQLGVGVVVGLSVPQEGLADALVGGVDRRFIGHGAIVSEHVAVTPIPWKPSSGTRCL